MPISKPFPQKTLSNSRTCSLEDRLNQLEQDQHTTSTFFGIGKYWMIYPARWEFLINNCRPWKTKSRITWTKWTRRFNVATTRWRPTRMNTMNGWNNGGKKDNLQTYRDLPSTLTTPSSTNQTYFGNSTETQGWTKTNQKDSSRPSLVHFPKWRPALTHQQNGPTLLFSSTTSRRRG